MSRCEWLGRLFAVVAISSLPAACGGDDDDGVDLVDGGNGQDSGTTADAGASVSAENLGIPCDEANLCPNVGEVCLSLVGGDGSGFCSVSCAGITDTTSCQNGYSGPGLAGCIFELADEAGGPSGEFVCGVVCEAPDEMCPADICAGTCPGDLSCTPTENEPTVSTCEPGDGGGGADAGVAAAPRPAGKGTRTARRVREVRLPVK